MIVLWGSVSFFWKNFVFRRYKVQDSPPQLGKLLSIYLLLLFKSLKKKNLDLHKILTKVWLDFRFPIFSELSLGLLAFIRNILEIHLRIRLESPWVCQKHHYNKYYKLKQWTSQVEMILAKLNLIFLEIFMVFYIW